LSRADDAIVVNESNIEWDHQKSPKGVFEIYFKEISGALTATPRVDDPSGQLISRRPFDVELVRIPPGKKACPKHSHSAQWEHYIVLSGKGRMVIDDGGIDIRAGDHIIQPPGWAHTVWNNTDQELLYYVIADNPLAESIYYPDSDKWVVRPEDKLFRMVKTTYYDGEE